jgi:di/tripeptidase
LDLRSEEVRELEGLVSSVRLLVAQFNQDPVTVTMERIGYRPAGAISRQNPLVQLATAALKQVGCKQIGYLASSTDANIPLSQGIQAVCIGLAESHNAHRFDEYIDLKKYPQGLTQVLLLVTALAQQPNAGEESYEL